MKSYFGQTGLLEIPGKRAAFSDRTAYLMAEMSRLAYFKFEGGNNITEAIEQIKTFLPDDKKTASIEHILKTVLVPSTAEKGFEQLAAILDLANFELIETFYAGKGAEAFLCRHKREKYAVLAWRGTEPSLKDIKADIKASLITVQIRSRDVDIHQGYHDRFMSLKSDIEKALKGQKLDGYQLFITGHSLGGALAITATKFLASDITGACYTFGSPPVGTSAFAHDIRTPIYRIINHVDIVPRLPNPWVILGVRLIYTGIMLVLDFVGGFFSKFSSSEWFKKADIWLKDAQKYRQCGYGSFLVGDGEQVQLRYTVGSFDKARWWLNLISVMRKGEFAMISEHSIDAYSRKLAAWAAKRQKYRQK